MKRSSVAILMYIAIGCAAIVAIEKPEETIRFLKALKDCKKSVNKADLHLEDVHFTKNVGSFT